MSVHFTEQYFSIRPQTWRSLIVYHDKNHFHASVRKSVSVSANFFLVKFADVFLDWTKLKHCFKLTWENSSTKVCSYEVTAVKKKKKIIKKITYWNSAKFVFVSEEWQELHQLPSMRLNFFYLHHSLPSNMDFCCTELQFSSFCYMQ